jgi:hypothetical protein
MESERAQFFLLSFSQEKTYFFLFRPDLEINFFGGLWWWQKEGVEMDTSDIRPAAAGVEFLTGRRRKKNLIPPEKQTGKNKNKIR